MRFGRRSSVRSGSTQRPNQPPTVPVSRTPSHPRPHLGIDDIEPLLAELTAAFEGAPRFEVEVCSQCYSEADQAELNGPLAAISEDLVSSVAAEVPDHWTEPEKLYRWMTPRIAASMVTDRLHVDPTLVAARLLDAGFASWPPRERDALLNVGEWWWRHSLSRMPDMRNHSHITDVLGFLAQISGHVEPWLATWTAMPPGPADHQMHELCAFWLPELHAGSLEVGWYGGFDIAEPIRAWLLDQAEPRLSRLGGAAGRELLSLEALRGR